MTFEMTHRYLPQSKPEYFNEHTAPDWLTGVNTVKNSTMDCRWFWDKHVLPLAVNQSIDTEFRTIKRISK